MKIQTWVLALSVGAAYGVAPGARADFAGQPILGPLTNGGLFTDSTFGKADDNDGFDSGTHIFNIWDGGDDVYKLTWGGGDLTVVLDSLGGSDNDLFVYSPGSLDSTGDYGIAGAHDVVTILGAGAGDYYINVDSTFFSEGDYEISVVPAPGAGVLLGVGVLAISRRRR